VITKVVITQKNESPPSFSIYQPLKVCYVSSSRDLNRRSVKAVTSSSATKAKQAWVKKVKLRSQWSKEKRKLSTDQQHGGELHSTAEETIDHETDNEEMEQEDPGIPSRKSQEKSQKQRVSVKHPSDIRLAPENDKLKEQREKIRDLTRQAYSRQTLHTFKSNSSKKTASRSLEKSNDSKDRREGVTGRGQPNMKLRMNALLEKIKMDAGVS
jgi:hypothetical protein